MSDGFLSRWARRKREARAAERDVPAAPEAGLGEAFDAEAEAPLTATPVADPEGLPAAEPDDPLAEPLAEPLADPLPELPPLDALTPESDLAPFLRAGVPAALRNAALRRMWSLDPAIRDFVSEAREYAYDWNSPGGVPGLGPLLPSDDVKAMLRRIVGGLPEEAPADDGAPGAAEAAEAAATAAPDLPDSAMAAPEAEDGPLLAAAPPAVSAPTPATEEMPVTVGAVLRSEVRPRLRRHGSAMPD